MYSLFIFHDQNYFVYSACLYIVLVLYFKLQRIYVYNFSVKISMGDLQSEENRDIVLELTVEKVHAPYDTTPQALLMSRVDYFNVITNELESDVERLTVLRPGNVP